MNKWIGGLLLVGLLSLLGACNNEGLRVEESAADTEPPASVSGCSGWGWKGDDDGVFRQGRYAQGEWIYTNGLWQARGANADGLHRTDYYAALQPLPIDPTYVTRDLYNALTYDFFGAHRAAHNGDYVLPGDHEKWPDGTGEVAQLRLAADTDTLYLRFLWNSMPRPDAQIATLTFASTDAPADKQPWPRNARLASGWQKAVTVWGSGATLTDASGAEHTLPACTGDHTSEVRVPLAALPASPWTLTGGSGLDDPNQPGRYWTVPAGLASASAPGSGGLSSPSNVWDLLFADDTPWTFDERRQADLLAAGDASGASAKVDLTLLQGAVTQSPPPRRGDISRLFTSRLFEADGIRRDSNGALPVALPPGVTLPPNAPDINVSYYYTGRLQTYSMHVPERYDPNGPAWPLIVYLHGFTGLPEEPFYNPVGLVQMADDKGYLLASALGRGDYTYKGEGDLDVLEVIANVSRHYRVDPDRIYLMGHSMGGYGTNNVGMHHPDLFAAIAPAEGTDSANLYANLRNLPWFEMTADEDLDVGAQAANALYTSLSAAGYDATLLEYRLKTHEYSSIYDTLPRLFAFFAAHRRNPDPAVISYTRVAADDRPDLGLIYAGAYWLSGLRNADDSRPANVTVTSDGIAHAVPDPARATHIDKAVDEGGPSGRTLAQLKQTIPGSSAQVPVGNVLHLRVQNASALRVDLARARLSLDGLRIDAQSDAALKLGLSGGQSADYRVDGQPAITALAAEGFVTLDLPAGKHAVEVSIH